MILLDSSFIIAYLNEADVNHAKALRMVKDIDDGKYGTRLIGMPSIRRGKSSGGKRGLRSVSPTVLALRSAGQTGYQT